MGCSNELVQPDHQHHHHHHHHHHMGFESDHHQRNSKWLIAGIPLRSPLKPIYTTKPHVIDYQNEREEDIDNNSTTPTGEESRILSGLRCPDAPKKRKPSLKCNYGGGSGSVPQFFSPPDLETVFIRHVERAN